MILKCITHDFPGRVTYGKEYKVIEVNRDNYYIVGDDNKVATVTPNSFNKYFVDLVEWREQQIEKIIKNNMSHLEGYNQYLVSNANILLTYIQENYVEYNISNLIELIDNINNSHGDKLEFYAEQLDRTIAMAQLDFGYVHNREYSSVQ